MLFIVYFFCLCFGESLPDIILLTLLCYNILNSVLLQVGAGRDFSLIVLKGPLSIRIAFSGYYSTTVVVRTMNVVITSNDVLVR